MSDLAAVLRESRRLRELSDSVARDLALSDVNWPRAIFGAKLWAGGVYTVCSDGTNVISLYLECFR